MYFYISILFVLAALVLLWLSGRQRARLGLPSGRLVYTDTGAEHKVLEPLYDADLQLVGRPDYLVEVDKGFVPVEVKSGRTPNKPYDSHVFQLAAYCLLVMRNYGRRPAYGIIRYPERNFRIDFSADLERRTLALLSQMRKDQSAAELHRSHSISARCGSCGFGHLCDERI